MLELFPAGLRGARAADGGSSWPRTPTCRARRGSGGASATSRAEDVDGLGGALARVPPAGSGRPALGRAAVGTSPPATRTRSSSTPVARSAPARTHDTALPRAAARARAGGAARRRLRLRRARRSPERSSASRRSSPSTTIRSPSRRRPRTPRRTGSSVDARLADALADELPTRLDGGQPRARGCPRGSHRASAAPGS